MNGRKYVSAKRFTKEKDWSKNIMMAINLIQRILKSITCLQKNKAFCNACRAKLLEHLNIWTQFQSMVC